MKKNNLIKISIAVILIVASLILAMTFKPHGKENYELIYFGDSIIAGHVNWETIPERLSSKSGLSVFSAAFGGMTMSENEDADYISNVYPLFSMCGLSECVARRDFSVVSLASKEHSEQIVDYWTERALSLQNIDFDGIKYVVIEHGVNDYLAGVAIDNPDDRYDTKTFAGALRYSIFNVKKGLPNAIIIIETPIYSKVLGDCESVDNGGGTLLQYIAKEKEVAKEEGVLLFDTYELSGINSENAGDYLWDGLHTNGDGNEKIASALSGYINSLSE